MTKSKLIVLKRVSDIINEHYEPFCLRHCYSEVWRKYVYPELGICYRTYKSYVQLAKKTRLIKCKKDYL